MGRQVFFGIKAQLSLFVCLVSMFCLGILSLATYVSNHGTLLELRRDRLLVIAELKSAQVTQAVYTLMGQVILLTGRAFIQELMADFVNNGNKVTNHANIEDFELAIEATDDVAASAIYDSNLNQVSKILSNDTREHDIDIPDSLFPALTEDVSQVSKSTMSVNGYIVGPEIVNNTYYMSMTRRLTENTPEFEQGNITKSTIPQGATIGYMTVVLRARAVIEIITGHNSINDESLMALVELGNNVSQADAPTTPNLNYTYVLAAKPIPSQYRTEPMTRPIRKLLVEGRSGSVIDSQSFNGVNDLSMGYSPVQNLDRQWGVAVYQTHQQVYQPLYDLRDMILISVFTIGFAMFVAALFLSGWIVGPIKRLQTATEKANPFLAAAKTPVRMWYNPWVKRGVDKDDPDPEPSKFVSYTGSVFARVRYLFKRGNTASGNKRARRSDGGIPPPSTTTTEAGHFQIPERVVVRRKIKDELTDLTQNFNKMTDELRKQYRILEDRVSERTGEIEQARVSAEKANEAKSLFIANITHELRTPLNGVLGMAALAMDSTDSEEIVQSLKIIFKSGELLLHLLTELLSFSKSNQDDMPLEEKPIMISELAIQITAIFKRQSIKNQIDFGVELNSECLDKLVVAGDVNRILQIVINLISNSLKFTPKGGKVACNITGFEILDSYNHNSSSESGDKSSSGETSIEGSSTFTKYTLSTGNSSSATVKNGSGYKDQHNNNNNKHKHPHYNDGGEDDDYYDGHEYNTNNDNNNNNNSDDYYGVQGPRFDGYDILMVTFEVLDTGPGIAPHLQAKIFEPFVQGDLQFSERRVGAGLGLSICKDLARLLGGTVTMESELGKGSTFWFKVPLKIMRDMTKDEFTSTAGNWPEEVNFSHHPMAGSNTPGTDRNIIIETSEEFPSGVVPGTPSSASDAAVSAAAAAAAGGATTQRNNSTATSNSLSPTTPGSPGMSDAYLTTYLKRPPITRNPSSRGSGSGRGCDSTYTVGNISDDDRKINFPVRVLVAEDNKVNQEVMIRMLKLEGMENVVIANDGSEAVSRVRETVEHDGGDSNSDDGSGDDRKNSGPFDIIFMDVQMPNVDGIQATEVIRNKLGYKGPIVAVSAFADESNISRCLEGGMDKFLAKPLRRPHLHRLLLDVLVKDSDADTSIQDD